MGAQEVVEADVLVSCDIDHLKNREPVYRQNADVFLLRLSTHFNYILYITVHFSSAYRLIGDDQLDDRQCVEHSNSGNVPGGKIMRFRIMMTGPFEGFRISHVCNKEISLFTLQLFLVARFYRNST